MSDEEISKDMLETWQAFSNYVQGTSGITKDLRDCSSNGEGHSASNPSIILHLLEQQRLTIYEECGFGKEQSKNLDNLIGRVEKFSLLNIVNLYESFKSHSLVDRMSSCTVNLRRISGLLQDQGKKGKNAKKASQTNNSTRARSSSKAETKQRKGSVSSPENEELGRGRRKKIVKVKFEFSDKEPVSESTRIAKGTPQRPVKMDNKIAHTRNHGKGESSKTFKTSTSGTKTTRHNGLSVGSRKRKAELEIKSAKTKKVRMQLTSDKAAVKKKNQSPAKKVQASKQNNHTPTESPEKKCKKNNVEDMSPNMHVEVKTEPTDRLDGPDRRLSSVKAPVCVLNHDEEFWSEKEATKKENYQEKHTDGISGQGENSTKNKSEEEKGKMKDSGYSWPDSTCTDTKTELATPSALTETALGKIQGGEGGPEGSAMSGESEGSGDQKAGTEIEEDNNKNGNDTLDQQEAESIAKESGPVSEGDFKDDHQATARSKRGRGPQKVPKKFPWTLVPIVCSVCKTRYSTYSTLRRHWTTTHSVDKKWDRSNPPNLLLCQVCEEVFNSPRTFLKHYRQHAASEQTLTPPVKFQAAKFVGERSDFDCDKLVPITCSICKQTMPGDGLIYGHWKSKHRKDGEKKPPPLFFCDKCETCFDAPRKFKLHYRIHTGARPHGCERCPKTFRTFNDLTAHMLCHGQSKQFKCEICGKMFISQKILNRHMKGHLMPCVCEVCGKTYPTKHSLNLHTKIHTGEKPHKCDICGVAFIQGGSLKLHRRLHLGEKPHVCETCGMRFNSLSHLRTHRRVHTGEKPYKCSQCSYAAASSSRLKDHMTVHADEKPHVCKVPGCGRRYKRLSHLIFHHRKHGGVKPYTCSGCGVAFKLRSSLSLHRRQGICGELKGEIVKKEEAIWSEGHPDQQAEGEQDVEASYTYIVGPTTANNGDFLKEEQQQEEAVAFVYHDVEEDMQPSEISIVPQQAIAPEQQQHHTITVLEDGTQLALSAEGGEVTGEEMATQEGEQFEQQIVIQIVREPGQEDDDIVLSKEELERIVRLSQQMN